MGDFHLDREGVKIPARAEDFALRSQVRKCVSECGWNCEAGGSECVEGGQVKRAG